MLEGTPPLGVGVWTSYFANMSTITIILSIFEEKEYSLIDWCECVAHIKRPGDSHLKWGRKCKFMQWPGAGRKRIP